MPSPASALRRRCTGYRINIGRKEGHVDGGGAAAAAAAGSVYDPNQTSKKCTVGLLFPHDKNVLKNPGAYKTARSKQTKYMLKVKMRLMFFCTAGESAVRRNLTTYEGGWIRLYTTHLRPPSVRPCHANVD